MNTAIIITAIIITAIICTTIVAIDVTSHLSEIADRKNFYEAVAKNPDAFNITEDDLKE